MAGERFPELRRAACWREDPGAIDPGRIVPDVLRVTALEHGDPVAVLVQVKVRDASVQGSQKR
jgi:hypothetical protein